jgi:hypothetical protein
MTLSNVAEFSVQVIAAGGGGALIIWLAGKTWVEKYLAHRFDRNLADLKNQHEIELEKFRQSATQQLERASRFNEAEFQLAKALWKSIREATLQSRAATMRFREYDDLSVHSAEKAREIMERYNVRSHHIEEVLSKDPSEWNLMFSKALDMYDVNSATVKVDEAADLLGESEIFLPAHVTEPIGELIKLARAALIMTRMDMRGHASPRAFDNLEKFHERSDPLLQDIKRAIKEHFRINVFARPN